MTFVDMWRNFTDSADIVRFFYVLGFVFLLIRIGEILEWSSAIAPSLWSHIERKNSSRPGNQCCWFAFIIVVLSCLVLLGKSLVLLCIHKPAEKISSRHLRCHCAWENAKMFAVFCLFSSFLQKFPSSFVIFWEKVPDIPDARIFLYCRPVYIEYKSINISVKENVSYWTTDDSTLLVNTPIVEPCW